MEVAADERKLLAGSKTVDKRRQIQKMIDDEMDTLALALNPLFRPDRATGHHLVQKRLKDRRPYYEVGNPRLVLDRQKADACDTARILPHRAPQPASSSWKEEL